MSKIKIKNFGPVKSGFMENDGYLDIRKVTVFIGDQTIGSPILGTLLELSTTV